METYRLSSKLNEKENEYLIQTANDSSQSAVCTNVYINGTLAETSASPHPGEVKAEEVLSLVKVTHNDKKREIETLLQAYRQILSGGNSEMMYQLGTAFFFKGFYGEARNLFAGAVALQSGYHQALNYLGMTELALGHIEQAIKVSSQAVEARPAYADYHNNLGEAYLADNACQEALRQFEEAIRINMYYADAYFNLGLASILQAVLHPVHGDWMEQANRIRDYFHKASLIDDAYRSSTFEGGLTALANKELKRALNIFRDVRATKREANRQEFAAFYMRLALFPNWVSERVVGDRIKFLEAEIERNPSYVDLQAELSACYLEQARIIWQKGVDQYRRTLELNPALQKVRLALEEAECAAEDLGIILRKITEQG